MPSYAFGKTRHRFGWIARRQMTLILQSPQVLHLNLFPLFFEKVF